MNMFEKQNNNTMMTIHAEVDIFVWMYGSDFLNFQDLM